MPEQGATITEPVNIDDWLLWQLGEGYNLGTGTLASGNYKTGTVLGQVTGGDYVQLDPSATDGSENFAGILIHDTDASSSPQSIVFLEDGPSLILPDGLTWITGITEPQKTAAIGQMLAVGIKTKTKV